MNESTVIALGFFDGVHIGHGELLKMAVRRAQERGCRSAAFTFDRSPREFVTGKPVPLLTTPSERAHIITHAVNDFCVNTLSSFYLDIVKDRLYCEGAESATRRSAQTALYLTLHTLSKLFAPILAFTCDEIWLAMPHTGDDDARNVVL